MRSRTRRSLPLAALIGPVVAGLVACAVFPGATPFVSRPDLIQIDELDVQLIDSTGLTEAVLPVPETLSGPFQRGVQMVPGRPRDLIVPWSGGDCDAVTSLTLSESSGVVRLSIRSTRKALPSGVLCTLGARLLAVVLRFKGAPPPIILDSSGS